MAVWPADTVAVEPVLPALTEKSMPRPSRTAVSGAPGRLLFTVSVADRYQVAVGANVMPTAQKEPGASVLPQVLELIAKSPDLATSARRTEDHDANRQGLCD